MRIHNFESFVNEALTVAYSSQRLMNLKQAKKELEEELKDLFRQMEDDPELEPEGGKVADEWGAKLEQKEKEIAKIKAKINKMETSTQRAPREAQGDAKKKLTKNIDDIKNSRKFYPERTIEQQAEIYKKRYKIDDEVEKITAVLKELENSKKI